MQKNKLNLHIFGIHLLNPYKTVVSHLNYSTLFVRLSILFVEYPWFSLDISFGNVDALSNP